MNNITLTGINQRMEVQHSKAGKPWVRGTIRVRNKRANQEGKYDSSFHDYKILGARAETFAKFQQISIHAPARGAIADLRKINRLK